MPSRLERVSGDIENAIVKAGKIRELVIQEEVLDELNRVDAALKMALTEIVRIMKLE